MVREDTTVKELLKKGYGIIQDQGTPFRLHLLDAKCPECGAYLIGWADNIGCTECDYEK